MLLSILSVEVSLTRQLADNQLDSQDCSKVPPVCVSKRKLLQVVPISRGTTESLGLGAPKAIEAKPRLAASVLVSDIVASYRVVISKHLVKNEIRLVHLLTAYHLIDG
jgi:hypothetical protein